jgi:hypothetical protein
VIQATVSPKQMEISAQAESYRMLQITHETFCDLRFLKCKKVCLTKLLLKKLYNQMKNLRSDKPLFVSLHAT